MVIHLVRILKNHYTVSCEVTHDPIGQRKRSFDHGTHSWNLVVPRHPVPYTLLSVGFLLKLPTSSLPDYGNAVDGQSHAPLFPKKEPMVEASVCYGIRRKKHHSGFLNGVKWITFFRPSTGDFFQFPAPWFSGKRRPRLWLRLGRELPVSCW